MFTRGRCCHCVALAIQIFSKQYFVIIIIIVIIINVIIIIITVGLQGDKNGSMFFKVVTS